jgi:hypothetical protein
VSTITAVVSIATLTLEAASPSGARIRPDFLASAIACTTNTPPGGRACAMIPGTLFTLFVVPSIYVLVARRRTAAILAEAVHPSPPVSEPEEALV